MEGGGGLGGPACRDQALPISAKGEIRARTRACSRLVANGVTHGRSAPGSAQPSSAAATRLVRVRVARGAGRGEAS